MDRASFDPLLSLESPSNSTLFGFGGESQGPAKMQTHHYLKEEFAGAKTSTSFSEVTQQIRL